MPRSPFLVHESTKCFPAKFPEPGDEFAATAGARDPAPPAAQGRLFHREASRAAKYSSVYGAVNFSELMNGVPGPKAVLSALGAGLGLYTLMNSYLRTDAGITYVLQNSLTGELKVYSNPGIHLRVPWFSHVTSYKQVMTASFGESGTNAGLMFRSDDPVRVRFADTYVGTVPCTFRFRLSNDPDQIRQMHKDFRSQSKLADTLLARNCKNVVIITATQYTVSVLVRLGP